MLEKITSDKTIIVLVHIMRAQNQGTMTTITKIHKETGYAFLTVYKVIRKLKLLKMVEGKRSGRDVLLKIIDKKLFKGLNIIQG